MIINFKIFFCYFILGISFYSNAQLDKAKITKDDNLFGVVDADSNWIVQPKYSSYEYLYNSNMDSVTGYIFQIEGNYIDIYDSDFDKTHRFKTQQYLLRGNYFNDGQQYLLIYDENKLSIYNLFIDDWLIRDKPFKIYNNECCQQMDSIVYFFLEDSKKNILVMNNLGQKLFQIAANDSLNVLPKLRKRGGQLILRNTYLDKDNNITKVDIQNMNGAIISVNEREDSRDYYLEYHEKTKTFFLKSIKGLSTKVYNEDFSLNRTTNEHIRTFDSFYVSYKIIGQNKCRYNVYESTDSVTLSFTTDGLGLKSTLYTQNAYAQTNSGYILLNESTLSSPIEHYINKPIYLGQKGFIMMIKSNVNSESIVDVFSPSGEIILQDYTYKSNLPVSGDQEYFHFEKDGKKIQLTQYGTIQSRK